MIDKTICTSHQHHYIVPESATCISEFWSEIVWEQRINRHFLLYYQVIIHICMYIYRCNYTIYVTRTICKYIYLFAKEAAYKNYVAI